MSRPRDPRDQIPLWPLTGTEEMAGQIAELFGAFVKAGIPPQHVAVIIGTWLAGAAGTASGDR